MARPSGRARANELDEARETSVLVLDAALARARRQGALLLARQRALLVGGATGVAIVVARGIVAVARGERSSVELAVALGIVFAANAALLASGVRTRARMERVARDVQSLDSAREGLEATAAAPRVEIRAHRTGANEVRPVVVVRTDDVEQLFRGAEPAESSPRSWSWLTRGIAAATVLVAALAVLSVVASPIRGSRHRWTFVDDTSSPDALGFRMGPPRAGPWTLEADEAATGARALVNRAGDGDAPAATLIAPTVDARDVRGVTRCRVHRDHPGGACGLVFRYAGDGSHHVARLEAKSNRIVLARVASGTEQQLASADLRVEPGTWYELGVEARGSAIRVSCNGRLFLDAVDGAPPASGSVGLWAPSDTEAYFDELAVEVLADGPQALEVLPLLGRRPS